ncbi:MAG: hypothetical protein ACKPKO_30840, partial [Candidatus Fonsibacter sp.]
GLIDARNHDKEDNLKSEKQLSKIEIVKALLERLGWESARDEDAMKKEDLRRHFVDNAVDDPLFKRQKRLNELFNLNKSYSMHKDMTPSAGVDVVKLFAQGLLATDPSGQGDLPPRDAERPGGAQQEE